jgi:hypothetical protein
MVVALEKTSLEVFFHHDDDADTRYELEDGELRIMPPKAITIIV